MNFKQRITTWKLTRENANKVIEPFYNPYTFIMGTICFHFWLVLTNIFPDTLGPKHLIWATFYNHEIHQRNTILLSTLLLIFTSKLYSCLCINLPSCCSTKWSHTLLTPSGDPDLTTLRWSWADRYSICKSSYRIEHG